MADDNEVGTPSDATAAAEARGPVATAGGEPGDWAAKLTDNIDSVVSAVHDRLVRPLLVVIRIALYGAIIAAMAAMIVLLGSIAAIRFLYVYGPWSQIWPVYVLLGGVLCAGGGVLFVLAHRARMAADHDRS